MSPTAYRGRFAPSPTGDLHVGSLVAAIASYCQAKSQQGEWLIRIEDIDETRTIKGADHLIIETLKKYGLESDRPVIYQTSAERQHHYTQAVVSLTERNLTFPCLCTRKQLSGTTVYPGTCRELTNTTPKQAFATKVKANLQTYQFNDAVQGIQQHKVSQQCGDFNIKRKDGLYCYQLAVVLDDAAQGITEVVRGIDIMESTGRQMMLIDMLGLPQPDYAHIPVITTADGHKLSKQNHAKPITHEDPFETTMLALSLLQQRLPKLKVKSMQQLLKFAVENWQTSTIKGKTRINYSTTTAG